MWSGSAASKTDLGASTGDSRAYGVDWLSQGGSYGATPRACMWTWRVGETILQPAGASSSTMKGAADGSQVGWVRYGGNQMAVMWHGTPESMVNLHTANAASSWLNATDGQEQVGAFTNYNGATFAQLWRGTAASAVNMHPAGALNSELLAVSGGWQVGYATISPGGARAGVWHGTASSFVDLEQFLPGGPAMWGETRATGVWSDGAHVYVSGYGVSYARARTEALMWTMPFRTGCGTADFNGDGDAGTDQDIGAFFACLSGDCCSTCLPNGGDFNNDGDFGTDQDIEAFFRVLSGGVC
jgi:hypothetical protein